MHHHSDLFTVSSFSKASKEKLFCYVKSCKGFGFNSWGKLIGISYGKYAQNTGIFFIMLVWRELQLLSLWTIRLSLLSAKSHALVCKLKIQGVILQSLSHRTFWLEELPLWAMRGLTERACVEPGLECTPDRNYLKNLPSLTLWNDRCVGINTVT